MSTPNLNQKQIRFVDEYLIDLNATQAAIRCGYSEKTAAQQASRLLANPAIQEAISKKQKRIEQKAQVTHEWVINNLKKVFERCMQEEAVTDKDGNFEGVFKFEHTGANRALELIGKHIGMFKERVEHTGKDGKAIEYANISESKRIERVVAVLDAARARRNSGAHSAD